MLVRYVIPFGLRQIRGGEDRTAHPQRQAITLGFGQMGEKCNHKRLQIVQNFHGALPKAKSTTTQRYVKQFMTDVPLKRWVPEFELWLATPCLRKGRSGSNSLLKEREGQAKKTGPDLLYIALFVQLSVPPLLR